MPTAVEEVLSDLGWNDGFRLPIANAENKRLEEEIEQKTRQRAALKTQLETIRERINDIRKHATDVRQEHRQNQRLLAAHSAQVETENNVYKQAQIDESKLTQEIKKYEKQSRESSDKINLLQQNVEKLTKRLEKTKKKVMLDKDKLFAWEEKLNQKDEKNMVIEQFVKSDEKTFKKIELERQTLSQQAEVYRQAVVKAVGDYHELELGLDRTARLYSQAIKYRRQLMDQWSVSVHVLTQRDKAIYTALQEINEQKEKAKEKLDSYQEAERFLVILEAENKELEDDIKHLERNLYHMRDDRQKLNDIIDSYSIELQVKKKHLQEVTRRVNDTRANSKRKKEEIENKRNNLTGLHKTIEDLKTTLINLDGQNLSTEERTIQLQDMLEKEEKRKSVISKEVKRQQALLFRASQNHKELEDERKVVAMNLLGETRRTEQLVEKRGTILRSLRELKEMLYQTGLELQRSESRLHKLLGLEKDRTETEAKQAKLKQLQTIFRDKADMLKILQAQVNQVNKDVRKRSDAIASNNEEIERLRAKQQHLLVMIEGGEKHLKSALTNYEERKVEENILHLKLKEAEKLISKVDDKLYDLEKYALQMEAAMQERRAEIKAQKEKLIMQKRVVSQECGELRMLVSERRVKIQQLQARIEIQVASLGANPEDGTPITSAYLVIQSAQERYLLRERGDELDLAIRKAEAEIRSMENTLRLVNVCNNKYKSSLSLVDEAGPEKAEQRKLDDELFNVLDQHRQRKQTLETEKTDCEKMKESCAQLENEIKRTQEDKENKRQTVENLEQLITEQKEKLLRADKNLKMVLKDIKKKCACISNETILLQERDIAVRELQELNSLALQRVAEFMIRHVEAEAYVKKLLYAYKIDLPFYLKQQSTSTPVSSRGESVSSRTSLVPALEGTLSSRESISTGSVVHLKPDFGHVPKARFSKSSQDLSSRRTSFKNK